MVGIKNYNGFTTESLLGGSDWSPGSDIMVCQVLNSLQESIYNETNLELTLSLMRLRYSWGLRGAKSIRELVIFLISSKKMVIKQLCNTFASKIILDYYVLLRRAEIHWNFSSIPKDGSHIYRYSNRKWV